jgi:acetylornithine/succinyldiaminopimelate/putrescine aminotransferase
VRAPFQDLLGPGTHASTFGGTPLACAVALKIFEVVEKEKLGESARKLGDWMKNELESLAKKYPTVVKNARGLGFMLGLELVEKEKIPAFAAVDKTASLQFVNRLHAAGVLTIPAGAQVVRLLPPLNLKPQEAGEGISKIEEGVKSLA